MSFYESFSTNLNNMVSGKPISGFRQVAKQGHLGDTLLAKV
jgi:hypothetical protein